MFSPMVFQLCWNTPVDPVKCIPAKSGCLQMTSPADGPSTKTRLTTTSGTPASRNTSNSPLPEYTPVLDGFHTSTLTPLAAAGGKWPQTAATLTYVGPNHNPP